MIVADRLSARAGRFALRDVTFHVPAGAWGIILGPAGSGKTTLLETIAGVRRVNGGRIVLRGVDATAHSPERRGTGIVYQHGFLFPHLTVGENLAYGARDAAAVVEITERFGVGPFANRSVASLSGGERQVVALARALVPRPDILLLDEPFAALDPRRRARVRAELRRVHRECGMTVLHVTHDFAEAGTLGDVAIVLDNGSVLQTGRPETLFRKPASGALADFLGAENVFSGTITRLSHGGASDVETLRFVSDGIELTGVGAHPGGAGHAVIRGEDIILARELPNPSSARNVLSGTVLEVMPDGVLARVSIAVGTAELVGVVTQGSAQELGLRAGDHVAATIKATSVHLC